MRSRKTRKKRRHQPLRQHTSCKSCPTFVQTLNGICEDEFFDKLLSARAREEVIESRKREGGDGFPWPGKELTFAATLAPRLQKNVLSAFAK